MRDDPRHSTSGGGMTSPGALLAGAIAGLVMRRTGVVGALGAAAGAAWLYQKWQSEGRLPGVPGVPAMPVHVQREVTIRRPRHEVFAFWRDPTNFPRFMAHVEAVTETAADRHHWTVRAPMGQTLEWDAILHDIEEDRRIRWRAVPPAEVHNEGAVWFEDADGDATRVRLSLTYDAPGGRLGAVIARLMGEEPGVQADDDLRRLKLILESGAPAGRE